MTIERKSLSLIKCRSHHVPRLNARTPHFKRLCYRFHLPFLNSGAYWEHHTDWWQSNSRALCAGSIAETSSRHSAGRCRASRNGMLGSVTKWPPIVQKRSVNKLPRREAESYWRLTLLKSRRHGMRTIASARSYKMNRCWDNSSGITHKSGSSSLSATPKRFSRRPLDYFYSAEEESIALSIDVYWMHLRYYRWLFHHAKLVPDLCTG